MFEVFKPKNDPTNFQAQTFEISEKSIAEI